VDTKANSRHELLTLDLGRHFGDASRIFARGSYFNEDRKNGTVIQINNTQLADFATGWNYDNHSLGTISARFFGLFESYEQTFSSVATGRNSETLTNLQRVPSQAVGGNAQWSRPVGKMQTLVAGFEMREVHGSSNEIVSVGTNLNGGRERTARVFGEDILQLTPRLIANLSLGYDHWSDFDARSIQIRQSGTTVKPFPERTSDAFNPRASLLYRVGHGTSLTAAGYRAFRSPTLNELYRSFRQGNTLTQNNAALKAERLTGAEAGVRQTLLSDRVNLRGTFFWNDVTNAIVNVTIKQDPSLTTRQRQNVSRTLSTGLNLDGEWRINSSFQVAGGYQFAHSVVSSYTPDPSLEGLNTSLVGKWIPQIPHQQFTVQTRYFNPKYLTATVQGTYVGGQFEDDLNTLQLGHFFTVDVYASRTISKGFEAYIAAENLFNQTYNVGLTPQASGTPLRNLGSPVIARAGLRIQLPTR
jgi:outer membrane receptor protein involved in Fe transport